ARHGADAGGNAEPRCLVLTLLGPDVRVRPSGNEPLPVRRAGAARASLGSRPAHALGPRAGRRLLRFVAAAALVLAALAFAAFVLYPSAVPDDLRLGPVDVGHGFGAAVVARANRYERFFYVDWALAQVALLVTLVLYARRGIAFAKESAAGPIGTGMLLGMLGLGIVWLVELPFGIAAHWWERHNGQSKLGDLEWAFQNWAVLAPEVISICFALLVVMSLARRLGERWWLPGAAVFVAIGAFFTFVSPYLDFTTHPLRDQALLASVREYESKLGIGHVPVRVAKVSDDTDQANAYAY